MYSFVLPRSLRRGSCALWMKLASLQRCCYSVESAKRFSELRGLHPSVLDMLSQQNITDTTDIQGKCLPSILAEDSSTKSCIINAETGSGKTLCFLLPIVQLLTRQLRETLNSVPVPLSLVLVPTSHLAHQIEDVFQSLALPGWGSSLSYKGSKLSIKSDTHLVIATPSSLANFSLNRLLKNVKILCVDEADVLLTGGEKQMTWNILEEMRHLYHSDVKNCHNPVPSTGERSALDAGDKVDKNNHHLQPSIHRQVIFTAATLPSRGPQSVQAQLPRWVPKNTLFFNTIQTHQVIPLARMKFLNVKTSNECSSNSGINIKFEQLVEDLLTLRESELDTNTSSQKLEGQLPKVLLFANTVTSAEEIFSYLERFAKDGSDIWWKGKVGKLHKQSSTNAEEKEKTLCDFKTGSCKVLVSTDLASRGLDLPDVTAVIQVDFPSNSADFLHRAGRTARAGKSGTVISYVGEEDRDLATEVREVVEDKNKSFDSIFSRNKMLRRRIKRKKAAAISQ